MTMLFSAELASTSTQSQSCLFPSDPIEEEDEEVDEGALDTSKQDPDYDFQADLAEQEDEEAEDFEEDTL